MNDNDRLINSEAYVITQTDYGEADRLYTIFSRRNGKIKAFARGIRKSKSRKAGHLQSLSLIHLMLAKGKNFWVVTQADTLNPYSSIKNDLAKTANAFYIFELIDHFAPENEPILSLFQLAKETLDRIERESDLFLIIKFFEFRLLKSTGYMPNLGTCVQCGEKILPQDQYFSAEQGGVLCPKCGLKGYAVRKISLPALRYLRFIQRSSYNELEKAKPTKEIQHEMESLMLYYLTYITEKALNTPAFIHQVEKTTKKKRNDDQGN
jgi:DNA repair protein RecO (recombination protein O)